MISVSEARERLFALVAPLPAEAVPLARALGRVLARDVAATRDQPPFAAASMDGYAVSAAEAERHAMFRVIGEAAAGRRFAGRVGPGQAVRIFTGAPMPEGAGAVIIQEDVRRSGDMITVTDDPGGKSNQRPAGADFRAGFTVAAPRRLNPRDIALLAAMNLAAVPVVRRPVVALISTGDELVMPGDTPGPDQIVASNTLGLKALLEAEGAEARILPIARDTDASLATAFGLAAGADLVVTIGGASVGDHDIVGRVAGNLGMSRSFYKVLIQPGKPLMAGRLGGAAMIGLPGNPVSAMVCGLVFLVPVVRVLMGLGAAAPRRCHALLAADIGANGSREHYLRASVTGEGLAVFADQDSALLSVLAQANALLVRAPHDPPRKAGDTVEYLPL